jgi:RNA polymerase sigma factor (TIGR02999 family)
VDFPPRCTRNPAPHVSTLDEADFPRADSGQDDGSTESALNHQDAARAENPTSRALRCRDERDAGGCVSELTQLLRKVREGEDGARDALFAAAYADLEKLARARLRQGGRSTLIDTRSLVHDSYLRCVHSGSLRAEDRRAFFAYASQVMRSVIVTAARERAAEKRGGGQRPVTLPEQIGPDGTDDEETILRVHEALESLEQVDARLAQVVQMRYFGGYSEQEVADTLQVTERTVQRLWLKARLMLKATME